MKFFYINFVLFYFTGGVFLPHSKVLNVRNSLSEFEKQLTPCTLRKKLLQNNLHYQSPNTIPKLPSPLIQDEGTESEKSDFNTPNLSPVLSS